MLGSSGTSRSHRSLLFPAMPTWMVLASILLSLPVALSAAGPRILEPPIPLAPDGAFQDAPSAAALPGGGYVVAFHEGRSDTGVIDPPSPIDGRDGSLEGVIVRLLDATGRPVGSSFVANLQTQGAQACPRVAVDPTTGGFVVAWIDRRVPVVRRFAADGTPLSGDQPIRPDSVEDFIVRECGIDLAVEADATALVAWTALEEPFGSQRVLTLSRVGVDGRILGEETLELSERSVPRLLPLSGGTHFVVWNDRSEDPVPRRNTFHGQRLDASGRFAGERIELGEGERPVLARLPISEPSEPDRLAFFWSRQGTIFGRELEVETDGEVNLLGEPQQLFDDSHFLGDAIAAEEGLFLATYASGHFAIDRLGPDLVPEGRPALLESAFSSLAREAVTLAADGGRLLVPHVDLVFVESALLDITDRTLRLGSDGRFEICVEWRDFDGGEGVGTAVPLAEDTGAFWFFEPANLELTVKVLDGRAINGHYWVFQGSLTNVEYTLTVTDTTTGVVYTVTNPLGRFGSFGDVEALPAE